ncbi:hypothetical protein [Roseateles koreensis]|uniref:Uncharacterized protein n=1 Tax=Roseateles koreensis TaxID=2987526 RepID=A0ABT5KVC5_9BURK|nr:hypothetical protein [Roseateles koreensis]MDC8786888.1 hypothetical protein [Roseateles koreensis]
MTIGLSTAYAGVSSANERLRASAQGAAAASASASSADTQRQQLQAQVSQADAARAKLLQTAAVGQTNEPVDASRKADTYAFVANLRVLQTQLDASGVMLNIKA